LKILLDECVDSRFAEHIHTIEVHTVVGKGWAGVTNGKLLALAQAEFDVFVTVDRNLSFQQHLPKFDIAVILLKAKSNRVSDLVGLLPELLQAIPRAPKGTVTTVGSGNTQ
jgi:hypothetical protein